MTAPADAFAFDTRPPPARAGAWVVVLSGDPTLDPAGVGCALAAALGPRGRSVLIDAAAGAPALPTRLGAAAPPPLTAVLAGRAEPAGPDLQRPCDLVGARTAEAGVDQLAGAGAALALYYPRVVTAAPSGPDPEGLRAAAAADAVVLVAGDDEAGAREAYSVLKALAGRRPPSAVRILIRTDRGREAARLAFAALARTSAAHLGAEPTLLGAIAAPEDALALAGDVFAEDG